MLNTWQSVGIKVFSRISSVFEACGDESIPKSTVVFPAEVH